jgi:hypothetical protein
MCYKIQEIISRSKRPAFRVGDNVIIVPFEPLVQFLGASPDWSYLDGDTDTNIPSISVNRDMEEFIGEKGVIRNISFNWDGTIEYYDLRGCWKENTWAWPGILLDLDQEFNGTNNIKIYDNVEDLVSLS